MFACVKVVIEKVVFKGRAIVMAEEIRRVFFSSGYQWYEGRDRGRPKPRHRASLGGRLGPQHPLSSSHVTETQQGSS